MVDSAHGWWSLLMMRVARVLAGASQARPVAVGAGLDESCFERQPINHARGQCWVGEGLVPFTERAVGASATDS
jgi:hypothetical protein